MRAAVPGVGMGRRKHPIWVDAETHAALKRMAAAEKSLRIGGVVGRLVRQEAAASTTDIADRLAAAESRAFAAEVELRRAEAELRRAEDERAKALSLCARGMEAAEARTAVVERQLAAEQGLHADATRRLVALTETFDEMLPAEVQPVAVVRRAADVVVEDDEAEALRLLLTKARTSADFGVLASRPEMVRLHRRLSEAIGVRFAAARLDAGRQAAEQGPWGTSWSPPARTRRG